MKHKLYTLLFSATFALAAFAQQSYLPAIEQSLLQQGFNAKDVEGVVITNQYTSKHNGVTHVYFRQQYKGITFFNATGSAHFKGNQQVALNQSFVKNVDQLQLPQTPQVGVYAILQTTANHLQLALPSTLNKKALSLQDGKVEVKGGVEPIKVQLYYLVIENTVKLVYNTNWLDVETNNWWNVRVDANTGEILEKNNWSVSCRHHSGHDFTTVSKPLQTKALTKVNTNRGKTFINGAKYNAFPLGIESPIHGSREILINPQDSLASPFGWHDLDGIEGAEQTITAGNNVYASDDIANTNTAGSSPDGGDSLVFDYPYDVEGLSTDNLNAAITNLFVWNNYMHDVTYHYGFDEESGNFQSNNYGRGGLGDDNVIAEAQDGSKTNNADFATPPDGSNGRMQMYLWIKSGSTLPTNYVKLVDSTKTDSITFSTSSFGLTTFDYTNLPIVLVTDQNATTSLGCTITQDLTGKVALIDRGSCGFVQKVTNAENAGAAFVIVANNTSSGQAHFSMSGTGGEFISIPSIMISQAAGTVLKQRLNNRPVFLTISNKPVGIKGALDSDLDNGVIAHEYGHGISNRLTGGPANADCLRNQEQMGEGWSDFFSLVLTHRPSDSPNVGRGIGTWLNNEPITGVGIRTHKYSRSKTVNPLTYDNIRTASIPHGIGTVWCTMLYDLYWNLIDKYGYDADIYNGKGGNNRAIQLVMDGMKLQPCSPGFVDARNAIIKANILNNNGEDTALIWSTFANRGLGFSASQGASSSRTDGKQAFDLPAGSSGLSWLNLESGIALWPNPNNGSFELMLPEGNNQTLVTMFDLTGKQVFEQAYTGQGSVSVNQTGLTKGIYFIKATNNGRVYTNKILITE